MLDATEDWREDLGWVKHAGDDGIIIFEPAGKGFEQDALRKEGFNVIGGSKLGDRLESDREFGQQALRDVGLNTAKSYRFTAYEEAIGMLETNPGRYVLKFNGANSTRTRNYIGQLDDSTDMRALLLMYILHAPERDRTDFVLMEYLQGVEVGVGAYFNGEKFLEGVCIDFEHKRFFSATWGN